MSRIAILKSDDNPSGWQLDELLTHIHSELKQQTSSLKAQQDDFESASLSMSNEKVMSLLSQAIAWQTFVSDKIKAQQETVTSIPLAQIQECMLRR